MSVIGGAADERRDGVCLQVLGTLLIYVLFMVEEFRKAPVENMDEVIYCVNGTYRLLEFLVRTRARVRDRRNANGRNALVSFRWRCAWCATACRRRCSASGA